MNGGWSFGWSSSWSSPQSSKRSTMILWLITLMVTGIRFTTHPLLVTVINILHLVIGDNRCFMKNGCIVGQSIIYKQQDFSVLNAEASINITQPIFPNIR